MISHAYAIAIIAQHHKSLILFYAVLGAHRHYKVLQISQFIGYRPIAG